MEPRLVYVLQQSLNALQLGSIYALIALGYTMVYGVLQLINFAHGEVFMTGSFAGLLAAGAMASIPGIPAPVRFLLALLAAMAACAVLGIVLERSAYRPLRRAPRLAPLITAIGASYFLQNAVMLTLGSQQHPYPDLVGERSFTVGGATISLVQVLIVVIATALMAGLTLFIGRTRTGRAMRACAADREAAQLMGVNTDRIIATTFALGSLLAGAGGVLYGMRYGTIDFFMGYLVGIKAFTAAVLGGIGNVPGAMLGGILLGSIEGIVAGWGASQWKDVVAFGVLVAVLLVRPSGLLGERVADKV